MQHIAKKHDTAATRFADTSRHSRNWHVRPLSPLPTAAPPRSASLTAQPFLCLTWLFIYFFCSVPLFEKRCIRSCDVWTVGRELLLRLWVTEREGRGALCFALLCSVQDAGDSRSPRCWKSERFPFLSLRLLTMDATSAEKPWSNDDRLHPPFVLIWTLLTSNHLDVVVFSSPPHAQSAGCIRAHVCNKTAAV